LQTTARRSWAPPASSARARESRHERQRPRTTMTATIAAPSIVGEMRGSRQPRNGSRAAQFVPDLRPWRTHRDVNADQPAAFELRRSGRCVGKHGATYALHGAINPRRDLHSSRNSPDAQLAMLDAVSRLRAHILRSTQCSWAWLTSSQAVLLRWGTRSYVGHRATLSAASRRNPLIADQRNHAYGG
jgi:hypothetical protein